MYLSNISEEVKDLFHNYDSLSSNNQLQVALTILEEWSNDQINSLDEANPNLLDDSIYIEIFNPESIGLENEIGNLIALNLFTILEKDMIIKCERLNLYSTLSYNINYSLESKKLISKYSKLAFIEKIDTVAELIIRLELKSLLKDFSDGFEIANTILEYKKNLVY